MAPAAIYSCLVKDTSTGVAIDRELADMGATPQDVASTFAVMAAAMLAEAAAGRLKSQAGGQVDSQDHCPGSPWCHCPQRQHGLTYSSISAS